MKPSAYAGALIALLSIVAIAGGCGRKTASDVNADVAKAETDASRRAADANAKAADSVNAAGKDARDQEKDSQHQIAVAEADAAKIKADGAHKVALAKCEGLTGTVHDSCKAKADADYEAAQASIKQTKAARDPTP